MSQVEGVLVGQGKIMNDGGRIGFNVRVKTNYASHTATNVSVMKDLDSGLTDASFSWVIGGDNIYFHISSTTETVWGGYVTSNKITQDNSLGDDF
jgi:hypothetical protein